MRDILCGGGQLESTTLFYVQSVLILKFFMLYNLNMIGGAYMKKLRVYVTSNVDKKEFFEKYKFSHLKSEEDKYYFYSNFTGKEEIEFECVKISVPDLAEDISVLLTELYDVAKIEAQSLSEEPVGDFVEGNSVKILIDSVIMKACYANEEIEIFELLSEIFIRMLMGHVLTNGNKRSATMFLKLSLKIFGYYLKWTSHYYMHEGVHKDKIENFVANMESNNSKETIKKTEQEIRDWVKYNVMFDLGRIENE